MPAWFQEKRTQDSLVHRLCAKVLKSGPIPKHIAIIMDGNRRFAKKNSMDRAQGHLKGFDKLTETLEWCLHLGIHEVTVYAFSIENFKRSKDEVDCLMELARHEFARLLEEKDMIGKHDVCVRVLGNLELLPEDVQRTIAQVVNLSKHNTRAVLNVCFSYTAREEICCAIQEMAKGVQDGTILESDISEELMERCLYTNQSPDPDLLIRTSGEVRLSDFLLWQSTFSVLSFLDVLWPDFSIWHMYAAVLHYQMNYPEVMAAKEDNRRNRERLQFESDKLCVLTDDKSQECDTSYSHCNQGHVSVSHGGNPALKDKLSQCTAARKSRENLFIESLNARREAFFDNLLEPSKS